MTASTAYPESQADGDLASPWTFPFSGAGHRNMEFSHASSDGWFTTDGTDTTPHSAQRTHSITTTGDWQVSFVAVSTSGAPFGVMLTNASLNGYYIQFDSFLAVRPVTGGTGGSAIASAARVAGAHEAAYIECVYTAATDTFDLYEDGVLRASGTNNTYEATAKNTLTLVAVQAGGVRTRGWNLYVDDTHHLSASNGCQIAVAKLRIHYPLAS